MAIATNAKYPRLGIRSNVRSPYIDDVVTNVKNDLNTIEAQIAAASIGTTNAETTAARPYTTDLKTRLDIIGSGQASVISGFEVSSQSTPDMTLQVAVGVGTVDGIEVNKTSITNTGVISAPTTNSRYDVVYINNSNTIGVATGSEAVVPVYPTIAQTQRPLAILTLTPSTTSITASEITDARTWGAYYFNDGAFKWKWKAQDAIDDIDDDIGGEVILKGDFYEILDINDKNNFILRGEWATVYRISSTQPALKCLNISSDTKENIRIINISFNGNNMGGLLALVHFRWTNNIIVSGCEYSGNEGVILLGYNLNTEDCENVKYDITEGVATDAESKSVGIGKRGIIINGATIDGLYPDYAEEVGTGYNIAATTASDVIITALTPTRVAAIVSLTLSSKLYTFDWDGSTWAQTGNELTIVSGDSCIFEITALSSTRVIIGGKSGAATYLGKVYAYDFDGTDWTIQGSAQAVASVAVYGICALSSTEFAVVGNGTASNGLRKYSFDGSTYTLIGSEYSNTSPILLKTIDEKTVVGSDGHIFTFDGSTWGEGSTPFAGSISTPAIFEMMTKSTMISTETDGSDFFFVFYSFDGEKWLKTGVPYATGISDIKTEPRYAAMSSTRVAVGMTNDAGTETHIRTYKINMSVGKPTAIPLLF